MNNDMNKYSLPTVLAVHVLPSELDAVAGGFFLVGLSVSPAPFSFD